MCICYFYILYGKLFAQILWLVFHIVGYFLIVELFLCLYIYHTSLLLDMWLTNLFSDLITCLHALNMLSSKKKMSMALPTRAKPSLPHSQSLPSGSFHKPFTLNHQRADRMNHSHRKWTKLTTWITAFFNSMKVWVMPMSQPRWAGHSGVFWQNVDHWRREWQSTPVFLSREPHGILIDFIKLSTMGVWRVDSHQNCVRACVSLRPS